MRVAVVLVLLFAVVAQAQDLPGAPTLPTAPEVKPAPALDKFGLPKNVDMGHHDHDKVQEIPDGHPEPPPAAGPEQPNPPLTEAQKKKIEAQTKLVKETLGQDFNEDLNGATNTEPTPPPQIRVKKVVATEKDHYNSDIKKRVASELDEIHYVLGTFVHLQRHHRALGTFNNTLGKKAFEPDGEPLKAKVGEDRLLRELKRTDEIMEKQETGKSSQVPAHVNERREHLAAPPSLNAEEFGQYRAFRDANGEQRLKTSNFEYNRETPLSKKFQDIRKYYEWLHQDSVVDKKGDRVHSEKTAEELDANPTLIGETTSLSVAADAEPVYEYESALLREHYITVDSKLAAGTDKWTGGHPLFRAFTRATAGTYPVYVFWNMADMDHRYSMSSAAASHETLDGAAFYAYSTQVPGTEPLHEFFNTETHDHIYSTDHVSMFAKNDKAIDYRGIIGYVFPLSAPTMPAMHAATEAVAAAAPKTQVKTSLLDENNGLIH